MIRFVVYYVYGARSAESSESPNYSRIYLFLRYNCYSMIHARSLDVNCMKIFVGYGILFINLFVNGTHLNRSLIVFVN